MSEPPRYTCFEDVPESDYYSNDDVRSFGVYGEYPHLNDYGYDSLPKQPDEEVLPPRSSSKSGYSEPRHREDTDDAMRWCYRMQVSAFVYWALLLKPVGDNRFERMGLAMLYPHATSALDTELTKLEIIRSRRIHTFASSSTGEVTTSAYSPFHTRMEPSKKRANQLNRKSH